MKLSDAAQLCEANSRAFIEVYKHYNFKDDDTLKDYCDFVIHEPVEWMRGFPAAWKSVGLFSKPRAAFHRLLKQSAVIEELTETYCENVHSVIWNNFKTHMNTILEKRNGAATAATAAATAASAEAAEDDNQSVISAAESDALTAESFHSDEIIHPVPPVPAAAIKKPQVPAQQQQQPPRNTVAYTVQPLNYKQKYEVLNGVLNTLLGAGATFESDDENYRLRKALAQLLAEFSRM